MFFPIVFAFLPFVVIFAIILRKSVLIQQQLEKLEEQQRELMQINSLLEIEKEDLLQKQEQLDKQLEIAQQNNERKQEELDQYQARQLEFHIIKFGRISAWGSPAYSISVDALGNILFHGKEAVRNIGFYQWKIYRKRIKNINSVIQKSNFFSIKESSFKSEMDNISGVVIEIYLKNGVHKKIQYDHAANYPIDLGFLERKLDLILGTKKMWLYWGQKVVQLSLKRGLNYKATFIADQGVNYRILGQEFFSDEYYQDWPDINELLLKYETLWSEETRESFYNHPKDTIWVEIETGFRFLISPHKHPEAFEEITGVIEDYGHYLQEKMDKKKKK